ncbi:hypothetical protein BGX38DRAFT_1274476 [Terfezia claveryi]|nr:hypothetical protein BGX38DRAFT_1274476 [Terfezia claveryi]
MLLQLPHGLHYPIHITAIKKKPDEKVKKFDTLVDYKYCSIVEEDDEFGGEPNKVEKWYPSSWSSPIEGILKRWMIEAGSVVRSGNVDLVEIEEPCPHDVQFGGMCAGCGMDMTLTDYTSFSNRSRADISMAHDNLAVTISSEEASRLEAEAEQRLLNERKLSLVVDLDQTIIHATVDPTVAQWQANPDEVNHEVLKDVQSFSLPDPGYVPEGHKPLETWYYVKLRPGLRQFLENVSKLYELHIYTMGTRAYALNVAKIVDPDGKIFGSRVLSRDESGSMTEKDLRRLFPKNTKMVVIIDDRGDVWKWSDNLIRVKPYDFFVGIGDINSSFLPKMQEFPTSPTPELIDEAAGPLPGLTKHVESGEDGGVTIVEAEKEGEEEEAPIEGAADSTTTHHHADLTTLEQLVKLGASDDKILLEEQAHQLSDAIRAQQESRPLAKLQHIIDLKDEAEGALENGDSGKETPSEHGGVKHRHQLIKDEYPRELEPLERNLTDVHRLFFEKYDQNMRMGPRGRRNKVPDVTDLMPKLKKKTFEGVVLVFSGVIPLGASVHNSDIVIWAKTFGATIEENLTSRVTHVIAARSRTAKVRQAARYHHIHLVTPQWLYDSMSNWKQMPLDPYRIAVHPEDRNPPGAGLPPDLLSDPTNIPMSSEDEDDEDELADEEMGIEEHAEELLKGGLKIDRDEIDKELREFLADVTSDDDEDFDEDFDEDIFGSVDEDEEADKDKDEDMNDRGMPNGNEAGESEEESVASEAAQPSPRRSRAQTRKRSRTPDDDGGGVSTGPGSGSFDLAGAAEDSDDGASMDETPAVRLTKRQKTTSERHSGLRMVVTPSSPNLPVATDDTHVGGGKKGEDAGNSRIPSPPPSDEGGCGVKSVRTSIVVTGVEDGGGGNKEEEVKTGKDENKTGEDENKTGEDESKTGEYEDNNDEGDGDSLFEELDEEAFAAALEEGFDS